MTIEEAKEHIPDFEAFCNMACNNCRHDYYCPQRCKDLRKTERMDFNRILKCYARHDGEMYKVFRWLKQARI
nr:MAG TPA: hypothetical protein [Caudoviricetes sp.]